MKKLSYLFTALAIMLSDTMCFVVVYNYRGIFYGIEHRGFSALASTAFLYAISFVMGIAVYAVAQYIFNSFAQGQRLYLFKGRAFSKHFDEGIFVPT